LLLDDRYLRPEAETPPRDVPMSQSDAMLNSTLPAEHAMKPCHHSGIHDFKSIQVPEAVQNHLSGLRKPVPASVLADICAAAKQRPHHRESHPRDSGSAFQTFLPVDEGPTRENV